MTSHRVLFVLLAVLGLSVAACASRPVVIKECPPPVESVAFTEAEVEVTEVDETGVEPAAGTLSVAERCEGQIVELDAMAAGTPRIAADGPGATLIEGVETFEVGGIDVILKRTPDKPVVSVGLYVRGGTANLTPDTAGLEEMMFSLVTEGGSESMPRDEMFARLNMMGTTIGASTGRTYSVFGLGTLQRNFDDSFRIFADVITSPALPEDELERQRARAIEFLKGLDEDADRYVAVIGQDLLYEDHPYALRHWGTVENVEGFDRAAIDGYHDALLTKERLLLVVVGDVQRTALESLVSETLAAKLPSGDWTPPPRYGFKPCPGRLNVFSADIPTSYVLSFFRAPAPGESDYYPLVVGMSLLRARLFEKIRTKLELSYAVSASVNDLPSNYGYLYLTSSYPAHALAQIYDEVESMQDWMVNATDLEQQVEMFITDHYMALETLSAQRSLLADAQLNRGDWRYSAEFIDAVRTVTPEQIRGAMQRWVRDFQVGYYGPPELMPESLATSDPGRADRVILETQGLPGPVRAGAAAPESP